MNIQFITVQQLLSVHGPMLDLKVVSGGDYMKNKITTSEVDRPGLALAGFFKMFAKDRVQLLGNAEVTFFKSLPKATQEQRLKRLFRFNPPCVIITTELTLPKLFYDIAAQSRLPLLRTEIPTSRFAGRLVDCLEQEFAQSMTMHGELVDVFGMGMIITGDSGAGKSEVALELIERGHRLVADDIVILRRISKNMLIGRSSDNLRYHMEVRGLGIIDVERLFGTGAVCLEKEVSLLVHLDLWETTEDYERLGLEEHFTTVLDVDLPKYDVPVKPGRNVAVLLEVTALHQRLKNTGYNPARRFDEELIKTMLGKHSENA
jgi:HPr kinase/phosphorylase